MRTIETVKARIAYLMTLPGDSHIPKVADHVGTQMESLLTKLHDLGFEYLAPVFPTFESGLVAEFELQDSTPRIVIDLKITADGVCEFGAFVMNDLWSDAQDIEVEIPVTAPNLAEQILALINQVRHSVNMEGSNEPH